MKLGTRVWSIGKVLLLVGALGATFVLFFFVSMRVAMRVGQVQVPELRGRTISEATRDLGALELRLRVDTNQRADDKIPVNHIVQQDPPAGVQARPQRTIRVWVSSGPPVTRVPALVGQTERTMRMRVEQEGLVATVSAFRSADYQADTVVAQDPRPASRAPKVALLLNRGEQETTYVMPDVIGMDGTRVEAVLRSHGFRVATVGSQPYSGIPAGTVVRQQPAAGFQVGPADAISLEVSR
jgi:eukaryotic-like serine/threonine-protein kinase